MSELARTVERLKSIFPDYQPSTKGKNRRTAEKQSASQSGRIVPEPLETWKRNTMEPKKISIFIGEYHASKNPAIISTVLGSCVAVCLYDPENEIGGMNHILLPGKAEFGKFNQVARYGINAMELLINKVMRLGARRDHLKAKVFGGAHLFSSISCDNSVGRKNAEFALEFLNKEGIGITAKDLGGNRPRKVFFYTDSGRAIVKQIKKKNYELVKNSETRRIEDIRREIDQCGDVTLF